MNGDPNQTSTKLRAVAVDVIKMRERPLASHEIETWIRENDKHLADLISSKCSDYVRIILSVTQDNCIVKYKSLIPIPGVDKRSTFYGLSDGNYNQSEWVQINAKPTKVKKIVSKKPTQFLIPTPKPVAPAVIEFPDFDQLSLPNISEDYMVLGDYLDEYRFDSLSSQMCIENIFEDKDVDAYDKFFDF